MRLLQLIAVMFLCTNVMAKESVIVGDLDWVTVNSLSLKDPARALALSVAKIYIPKEQSTCNAFVVAHGMILTNHHCVPNEENAEGVVAVFNDFNKYNCDDFIATSISHDMTLLRCQNPIGMSPLKLDFNQPKPVQDIFLIHWNCNYYANPYCKSVALLSPGQHTEGSGVIKHNGDTLPGSSGSPVFNAKTKSVIAIHFGGLPNDGDNDGHGKYNNATSLWAAKDFLAPYLCIKGDGACWF